MSSTLRFLNDEEISQYLEYVDLPSDERLSGEDADSDSENETPDRLEGVVPEVVDFGHNIGNASENETQAGLDTQASCSSNENVMPVSDEWNSLGTILGSDARLSDSATDVSSDGSYNPSECDDSESDSSLSNESYLSSDEDESQWKKDRTWFENAAIPPFNEKFTVVDIDNISRSDITPLHFFKKMFSLELAHLIARQTNLYAQQQGASSWNDFSEEELFAFLGVLVMMGIHVLPTIRCYWSSNPLLNVESVCKVMTRNRFEQILRYLHCNNNEMCPERNDSNYDKLYKLRPMLTSLNEKCQAIAKPSSKQSIDESMIPFKGRNSMKQYQPLKPIKRGYKVWVRADACNGFVCQFEVYTGKTGTETEFGLGEKVIINLTKPIAHDLSLVCFDNFFTSTKLMETLYENGVWACGTVRTNRVDLPEMMKTKKCGLKRGEHLWRVEGNVTAVQWMDKKAVNLLSTAHDPQLTREIHRTRKDGTKEPFQCPDVVYEYNANMGGVDLFDQKRVYYQIGRRSKKWWHRIFYWLIDLCIINSSILYNYVRKSSGKDQLSQLEFRLLLIPMLIGNFSSKKRKGPTPKYLTKKSKKMLPKEIRISGVGIHMPSKVSKYRRCRLFSTSIKEKRTKIICVACQVPLCTIPCFSRFHN